MSVSLKHARRERALEAVRRHLKRLEIETHRVKAELARLEGEYEDDFADDLAQTLRRHRRAKDDQRLDASPVEPAQPVNGNGSSAPDLPTIAAPPTAPVRNRRPLVRKPIDKANPIREAAPVVPAPRIVADADGLDLVTSRDKSHRTKAYRRTARPLLVSFGIHAIVLLLCVSLTFATLGRQEISLFASPAAADELPEQIGEIEITAHKFADDELQNVVSESDEFNVSDSLLREFDPARIGAGSESLADMGQLNVLPSDLGSLMAGAGEPGGGKNGGPLGEAVFFGAHSKGDRFVFVVDNSSSMKDGRFNMAIAELVKSVGALSPRQSFYVIFVSDQPYPMFYPVPERTLLPATAVNKKRLADWLPKAILASGKNRELIKAMDLAATLQPQAVFLLWDGDMKYSDKVRLDVMTHLTQPNQWNFTIHTLGLGVTSLDSEYNLTAIAKAHGGTYRRVDVPAFPKR